MYPRRQKKRTSDGQLEYGFDAAMLASIRLLIATASLSDPPFRRVWNRVLKKFPEADSPKLMHYCFWFFLRMVGVLDDPPGSYDPNRPLDFDHPTRNQTVYPAAAARH